MKSSQQDPLGELAVPDSDQYVQVEVLDGLSVSRSAEVEKLKYTEIVPALQVGPEAAHHLSAYSRCSNSMSTHEKWMEIHEDCSSSPSTTKLGSDRQETINPNSSEDHEGARYLLNSRTAGKASEAEETNASQSYVQSKYHNPKYLKHLSSEDDERETLFGLRNEQAADGNDVLSRIHRGAQLADTRLDDASYHQYKRREHCTNVETQGRRTNKVRLQTLNDERRIRYSEKEKSGASKLKLGIFSRKPKPVPKKAVSKPLALLDAAKPTHSRLSTMTNDSDMLLRILWRKYMKQRKMKRD